MGLALIGLGDSRIEAPQDCIKWGLAWDRDALDFDRVFEIHSITDLERVYKERFSEYWQSLEDYQEVVMQSNYLDNSIKYPLNQVKDLVGDFFDCSAAYMLALAFYEGWDEIGLYGFDCGLEYEYQKENLSYLLGVAKGLGVKVHLPSNTPLLQHKNPLGGRYGWQSVPLAS